jgi:hypothetical protein
MIRLRWLAGLAVRRLGWQGLTGIGLMVAACVFHAAVTVPMDARLAGIRGDMALPHKGPANERRVDTPDPAAELDAFYREFPGEDALTDLLAKLHRIADEHGLALQQADYRAADERGPRLGQYRITVPAVATYPQLKQFLAAVLTGMPNLSLDQLSLQRHAVADARVDAQMQFTLYLRQRT